MWFSLGFVLLRGVAGVLTRSDAVYFGPGIVNNFVIAAAFAVSVVVRRPIVGYIAPVFYRFPDPVRKHPTYTKVFGRLTLAWALLCLPNLGGPALAGGSALGPSPGLATLVGRAVGLRLSVRGTGSGGGLAPDRRCGHGRTPREEKRWACREAVCGGAGSDRSHVMVANGNHAILAKGTGSGSLVMGPKCSPAQSHMRGRLAGVCATIEAPSRDTHRQRSG